MGNRPSSSRPAAARLPTQAPAVRAPVAVPAPPKCSKELTEVSTWQKNLDSTRKIYEEKRLLADKCTPEQAAARAKATSGPSECQVNDVQLNMARNDVVVKDAKWEQCYPEEATQRRLRTLRQEATEYERTRRNEQREANTAFATKVNAIEKLSNSAREMYKTLFDKEKELASLIGSRQNHEQLERRERRLFLDNSPQSGVGGVPGVRTEDDRVLLTFWITYGAAIIGLSLFILQMYGGQIGATDLKSKTGIVTVIALIAYAIAYYCITYYG